MNINIYYEEDNLIIDGIEDFKIDEVLECGQCFHFTKICDMEYELLAFDRYLRVCQEDKRLTLFNTTMEDYEAVWRSYFDMDTDYAAIKTSVINADERLRGAVCAKSGIRILKQDFFETLISFIISQNKQIPHIKQIVHTISEKYGNCIKTEDGRSVYSFPTAERLYEVTEDELRECKVGFRAPYIRDAVEKVYRKEITREKLASLSPNDARNLLMTIKGVGEKVANCVMLFGLSMTDSFPVDVWIKRIMEKMYFKGDTKKEIIEKFAYEKFGEYAGYAQQYLFCYGRELGIGK